MRTWDDLFIGIDRGPGGIATPAHPESREGGGRSRWLGRFRESLTKSRRAMTAQLGAIAFDPADSGMWERIEEGLIAADVGVTSTVSIVARLEAEAAAGRLATGADLARSLRTIAAELMRTERSSRIDLTPEPTVLMMVGVNGTGKTTTIGKLAHRLRSHGRTPLIAAGDTYRAAAAEQLEVWAQRSGSHFVRSHKADGDPGAVAWDAIERGRELGADVILLDTAGRLHTQGGLMQELAKVRRVLDRQLPGAPHETLLSIDATTGQNGMRQAREFADAVAVTGIVLTKLDGTAKGGIGVAIAAELGMPLKLVGIGEGIDDLQPFDADDFLLSLFPDDLLG